MTHLPYHTLLSNATMVHAQFLVAQCLIEEEGMWMLIGSFFPRSPTSTDLIYTTTTCVALANRR